jgi:cytochrome c peroxidase
MKQDQITNSIKILTFITLILFCNCERVEESPKFQVDKPAHFPKIHSPKGNELTTERVALGRKLFYEKALSIDSTLSCATCHLQRLAFSDGKVKSLGVKNSLGARNAPALINLAYDNFFFHDGGVTSLETQAMSPILNHAEMAFGIHKAGFRLAENPIYQQLSQAAYNREMSAYVIVRALAAFERTLISGNTPFDAFFYKKDSTVLTKSQQQGLAIFNGKANCIQCHSGFNFTSFGFANNGLYQISKDKGRSRISLKSEDEGKFKIPTLRNIAMTSPYMHDGSLPTLESVIEHYNSGGKQHENQSEFVRKLNLMKQEKIDLVNFLHSLTDTTFLNNPRFGAY